MKKIVIILWLLACAAANNVSALDLTFAQKVGGNWVPVPSGGSVTLTCKQNYLIDEYLGVTNNTTQTYCIWMGKSYGQKQASPFFDTFCWDKCYNQNETKSVACLKYNPGQTKYSDFRIEYDPQGNLGETVIRYTFWPTDAPGDSAWITVHLVSQSAGINEAGETPSLTVSPNPCFGEAVFSFANAGAGPGNIIIADLLGNKLKTIEVAPGPTRVKADLSALAAGVYLYYFQIANRTGKPGKLIIDK
ncbi:MAG: T9SS type A sorting domain-containing protein [Bacteroidales bacterium]